MRELKSKVLVIAVALMAAVILASSVCTALAVTINIDYQYGGGNCIIDVPGKTRVRLVVGCMKGNYYSGKADRFDIFVDTGKINPSTGLPVFKTVIAYEYNAVRWAFSTEDIAASAIPPILVNPWQIGIIKIGKTNFVYWTIPLVAPATGGASPTPEVVIPPGMLVLRGYGEPISGEGVGPFPIGPNGWIVEIHGIYYLASATLLCPRWHYCGPVAEDFEGTDMQPHSAKERTWTWTLPDP